MDKCEIHPHCFKQGDTPCPACVSQAALDNVKVAPRKMTATEERLVRLLEQKNAHIIEIEERFANERTARKIYGWLAISAWACLAVYAAFGGPQV